jgi:hypothetical protein
MTIIKTKIPTNISGNAGEKKLLYTVVENVN